VNIKKNLLGKVSRLMINMTEETLVNRVVKVLKDFHKTPEERREFVNTITEKK